MIEIKGVTKRYRHTVALDDVSFTVPDGTVTGFLGPNGAGKSTCMRVIASLDRPDAGTTLVNGSDYAHALAPLRELGALLDASSAHPRRSARNHLLALAATHGLSSRRVDDVLEMVGLSSVSRRPVKTFSLGMRQRLGVAQALLGDPQNLILDEPVNGLDPAGVRWMRILLRRLAQEGRCVMLSSHLMSEVAAVVDRVVIIAHGNILRDESLKSLMDEAGGASLEDLFLELTEDEGQFNAHGENILAGLDKDLGDNR